MLYAWYVTWGGQQVSHAWYVTEGATGLICLVMWLGATGLKHAWLCDWGLKNVSSTEWKVDPNFIWHIHGDRKYIQVHKEELYNHSAKQTKLTITNEKKGWWYWVDHLSILHFYGPFKKAFRILVLVDTNEEGYNWRRHSWCMQLYGIRVTFQ